jgi:hypothetical protein
LFHFGEKDWKDLVMQWNLLDDKGAVIKTGNLPAVTVACGGTTVVGKIEISLSSFVKATQVTLQLKVKGTALYNQWKFWVYPSVLPGVNNTGIYITDTINKQTTEVLQNGGKVLLLLHGKVKKGSEVVQSFTPVFWNTSWFQMKPPHTLGLLIDTTSKLFANFPTSYHSDLQWWDIVTKAQAMHLENFPKTYSPLIRNIDTWFMNRRLTMLFEVNVGKGKLMVCSADIMNNLEQRPVARQLLYAIKQYMQGNEFKPKTNVSLQLVEQLLTTPSNYVFNAFTKDSPDELKPIK